MKVIKNETATTTTTITLKQHISTLYSNNEGYICYYGGKWDEVLISKFIEIFCEINQVYENK